MEKKISKELVKRIKSDTIINTVVAVGAFVVAILYLLRFITTLISRNFESNDLQLYAENFVETGCLTASLVILSSILNGICKTGKPFTANIVKKFKAMAAVLIAAVPLAMLISGITGFLDPTALGMKATFSYADILMLIFGVISGIIAEIFYYGTKLEEEMDMIA